MLPVIEGCLAAVVEGLSPAELSATVADLVALDATTDVNPELHGVLADTAVPARLRAAVLRDLLQGKLSAPAIRLASYVVTASHAQDVSSSLHDLTVLAGDLARDGELPVEILSLTESRARVRGYADAHYESASPADLERAEDELFQIARVVEASRELRTVLVDRDVPAKARAATLRDVFNGKVSALTLNVAAYAVIGGRPRDIVGTLDSLVDHAAETRRWRAARVWSARDLSTAERDEIRRSLASVAGEQVDMHVTVQPDLLAGVIVEVGDLRLDATASGRLRSLHDALSSGRGTNSLSTNE